MTLWEPEEASSPGRHHPGMAGDLISEGGRLQIGMVGEVISQRWATSRGIRTDLDLSEIGGRTMAPPRIRKFGALALKSCGPAASRRLATAMTELKNCAPKLISALFLVTADVR